jgi:hypothetical protein
VRLLALMAGIVACSGCLGASIDDAAKGLPGNVAPTPQESASSSVSSAPFVPAASEGAAEPGSKPLQPRPDLRTPHVTVATFDTGTNPFHPAWKSGRDAWSDLWGLPSDTVNVTLAIGTDLAVDRAASSVELAKTNGEPRLVLFKGTRLLGLADPADPSPILDDHGHGAQASSQIAGAGYGLADNAYVVAMDFLGGEAQYGNFIKDQSKWVAQQEWIDIVHINYGTPAPLPFTASSVVNLLAAGKLVVVAGLNGLANGGPPYPTELGEISNVPGSLVAGANDQCLQGSYWSNLDPHVVMDGMGTVAGDHASYGNDSFAGTSSSSPRVAGYAAELLYQTRLAFGIKEGMRDGALVVLPNGTGRPTIGPLADGRLTAVELHEVIRKTARPSHDSWMDGEAAGGLGDCIESNAVTDSYPKVGYGEVSEHTLPDALAAILGERPMPIRPMEDWHFAASEATKQAIFEANRYVPDCMGSGC